jgi:hypothetical protein
MPAGPSRGEALEGRGHSSLVRPPLRRVRHHAVWRTGQLVQGSLITSASGGVSLATARDGIGGPSGPLSGMRSVMHRLRQGRKQRDGEHSGCDESSARSPGSCGRLEAHFGDPFRLMSP